jgi:hypothetical protein
MSRAGLAALALAGAMAGCGSGGDRPATPARDAASLRPAQTRLVVPAGHGALTLYLRRSVVLRARPRGPRLAQLRAHTEFGSPRVVAVVRRRGHWLGVLAPQLPNGRVGWLRAGGGMTLFRVDWSLVASISRRVLVVRRAGRVVRRVPVAVGSPAAPTPGGRFAVTDKLLIGSGASPYGCCALALTGHQPRVPQGWGGGDRLAIHGTSNPASIGQAVSHGCLRAGRADMERLVRQVPLGTRVRFRA